MPTFEVHVPAPTWLKYEVEAEDEDDALAKIKTGEGDNHKDIDYISSVDGDVEWNNAEVA
jgi:hypothetical protein